MNTAHDRGLKCAWIVGLLLCTLMLTGCQTAGGTTHSVKIETVFYLDGPQQARPPDGSLAAGTRVTLVNLAGSYAQVVLPDGRQVYLATDSLVPLR